MMSNVSGNVSGLSFEFKVLLSVLLVSFVSCFCLMVHLSRQVCEIESNVTSEAHLIVRPCSMVQGATPYHLRSSFAVCSGSALGDDPLDHCQSAERTSSSNDRVLPLAP